MRCLFEDAAAAAEEPAGAAEFPWTGALAGAAGAALPPARVGVCMCAPSVASVAPVASSVDSSASSMLDALRGTPDPAVARASGATSRLDLRLVPVLFRSTITAPGRAKRAELAEAADVGAATPAPPFDPLQAWRPIAAGLAPAAAAGMVVPSSIACDPAPILVLALFPCNPA